MKKIVTLALILLTSSIALASSKDADPLDLSRYRRQTTFKVEGIVTPKVIKMISKDRIEGQSVLLRKKTDEAAYTKDDILPHKIHRAWEQYKRKTPVRVEAVSSTFEGQPQNLVDGTTKTFMTFNGKDRVHRMRFVFDQVTEVSSVRVVLGEGVLPPSRISVEGLFANGKTNVIERNRKYTPLVSWPAVKVKALMFEIEAPHLFRVAEVDFGGSEVAKMKDAVILFGEEGAEYMLYHDPAFGATHYRASDYQPLSTDKLTPEFDLGRGGLHGGFDDDFDDDGLRDEVDLCPRVVDTSNLDKDDNGRGDVCEDPDLDRIMSLEDNCPFVYNRDQKDSDQDSVGDACDDEENRVTEHMEYLLPMLFGLVVLVLVGLVWRSLRHK